MRPRLQRSSLPIAHSAPTGAAARVVRQTSRWPMLHQRCGVDALSAELAASLASLSAGSAAGSVAELELSPGGYDLSHTLVLDETLVVSSLRLVASSPGAVTLRMATRRRLSSVASEIGRAHV